MSDPSIDILSRYLKELVDRVLEVAGRDAVRAVFAGGSLAGGEMAYRTNGAVTEFYSDIDLYVVVDDTAGTDDLRGRCAAAGAGLPLEGDGYVFSRAPDVGVYTFETLASQPARPGTVGLDRRHMMLYGDGNIPKEAARRIGDRIAPDESLYLLENRLLELWVLENSAKASVAVDPGYLAYVGCKTCLDAGTATLVANGMYATGRYERMRKLEALAMGGDIGWSEAQLALATLCERAIRRMPAADWADPVPPGKTIPAVTSLALEVWKRIAARVGGEWSATVMRRCRTGEYLRNFRQFRALYSRNAGRRRRGVLAGAGLSRYSPVDALRMSALIDYLDRDENNRPGIGNIVQSVVPFLDRLTRLCGFADGELVDRASRMLRSL